MFRHTDSQATFGSLNVLLSPQKIARLEKNHWAGGFRRQALPVLLANEETFRPLFCQDNGRPNKPAAATLGLIILKEMFDLTDEAAWTTSSSTTLGSMPSMSNRTKPRSARRRYTTSESE